MFTHTEPKARIPLGRTEHKAKYNRREPPPSALATSGQFCKRFYPEIPPRSPEPMTKSAPIFCKSPQKSGVPADKVATDTLTRAL